MFSTLKNVTKGGYQGYRYQCHTLIPHAYPALRYISVEDKLDLRCQVKYNSRSYPHTSLPLNSSIISRHFQLSAAFRSDEEPKPSSKVEETVKALKEKAKEEAKTVVKPVSDSSKKELAVKKSLVKKIVDELKHYWHGFRLLGIDINVCRKLVWRVLNGHKLTRREYKLLLRVVGDIFRLIPFSVFIIVPCMELLLPVFIKLFPGMLPSTFQTAEATEDKMKQSLKVKLKMAKFLQQTLDEMAVSGKGHSSESAKNFGEFFAKIRTGGNIATTEEIMKFSKLFQDEITLDSLPRAQLMALCRVLEIQPFGTTNFLRFQLQMKLKSLAADDKVIQKEGINSLNLYELQQACKARGMRALGMSENQLRAQLSQWLDLSLNEKVPPSLLLLSRAFMLPETTTTSEKLAATISALPETVATKTKEAIGELEGRLDNKTKIEVIKEEVKQIKEERKEDQEERQKEILLDKAPEIEDKATILEATPPVAKRDEALTVNTLDAGHVDVLLTGNISDRDIGKGPKADAHARESKPSRKHQVEQSIDVGEIENALNSMSKEKNKLIVEKEELNELKEELAEYKEDVETLKELPEAKTEIKETKAAKRLSKVVNKLINKLDAHVEHLEKKGETLKKDISQLESRKEEEKEKVKEASAERDELLRIDEIIDAIRKIQKVPDESRLERIEQVLEKMDDDFDGSIRLDIVLKVIEQIGSDSLKLSKKQIDEIIEMIKKEEELEDQLSKDKKETPVTQVKKDNEKEL